MKVKLATTFTEQSSLFYVMLALMLWFQCIDLLTDYLVDTGATAMKIGGDMAHTAFREMFLVLMLVARSGGQSIASKLGEVVGDKPDAAHHPNHT